jgi:hypothetical protein
MRNRGQTVASERPGGIDSGVRDPIGGIIRPYRPPAISQPDAASIYRTIERVTDLMERAIRIPGTRIRFGLDPILGFVFPEGGDVIGAVVSVCLVLASVRHGLPKAVIARMVFNIALDYLIGSVPLIGDMFDFAWKANTRNLELLKKHSRGVGRSFWSDWGWAIILLSIFAGMVIGIVLVSIYLIRQVLGNISLTWVG